jgi:hypothetical protein
MRWQKSRHWQLLGADKRMALVLVLRWVYLNSLDLYLLETSQVLRVHRVCICTCMASECAVHWHLFPCPCYAQTDVEEWQNGIVE